MTEVCIHDLHASLTEDSSKIGTFIAIARGYYTFALYLGKKQINVWLILINSNSFDFNDFRRR
jgi:hypothetical protein